MVVTYKILDCNLFYVFMPTYITKAKVNMFVTSLGLVYSTNLHEISLYMAWSGEGHRVLIPKNKSGRSRGRMVIINKLIKLAI